MNELLKKSKRKSLLLLPVLLLLAVLVIFSSQICVCTTSVPSVKPSEGKEGKVVESEKVVFTSLLAGKWYSADAEVLKKQLEGFFRKADVKPIKDVIGFILPHAGYYYSGQTAVDGLKAIDKKYKRIVVIGPSHYVPMQELLSVPRAACYRTPLGTVPLDTEFIDKLLQYPEFVNVPQAHKYEHSVQIELPLLQYSQKDFKFVPIVAGKCSLATIKKAAGIIKGLVDEDTLVIASSDFCHYGPNYGYIPFTDDVPANLKKIDAEAYKHIAALDAKGFVDFRKKSGSTICGAVPVELLLCMVSPTTKVHLISKTNSGEVTGDFTNSVGYMAIAFTGKWPNSQMPKIESTGGKLSVEDKKQLLTLARKTIEYYLKNKQVPQPSQFGIEISEAMKQRRAAFVTLEKHGQLRGCIGDIFPRRPLYESVIANAINAAVNDRRFMKVKSEELKSIEIEISALTIPKVVSSPNEIRIGIDGVILSKNGRRAVYLPQVAPQQGWNVEQTLTHLSRKAGLDGDAWRRGAKFEVFEAVVFSEEK